MKKILAPAPSPLAAGLGLVAAVFGALYARQKTFDVVETIQKTLGPEPKNPDPSTQSQDQA